MLKLFPLYKWMLFAAEGEGGGGGGTEDPPVTPPPSNEGPPSTWDEVFKHNRFKQLNQRTKEAEARLAQLEVEAKTKAEEELVEQQKWEDLANRRKAELDTERLDRLRLTVAISKELPPDFAERLKGGNQAELEADADKMLTFVRPATGPGVPPKSRGGSLATTSLKGKTAAEVREAASKKGLADLTVE